MSDTEHGGRELKAEIWKAENRNFLAHLFHFSFQLSVFQLLRSLALAGQICLPDLVVASRRAVSFQYFSFSGRSMLAAFSRPRADQTRRPRVRPDAIQAVKTSRGVC